MERLGGFFGESASISNATVRQKPTDDKEKVLEAIQKQLKRSTVSGTNIEAGLLRAEQNFSSTANNKIIILLSDGIPNADVKNTDTKDANDVTDEGCIKIGENTKNTLLKIKNSGIYTITLLTGMSESDGHTDKSGQVFDDNNTLEEKLEAAENIFGTQAAPTANKYYLVNNVDIKKIISEDILNDVTEVVQNPMNSVKVVDHFPEDITDNFEFSYVGKPTIGTTSDAIDSEENTITWDIGTLKGNEVATLKYKLKIKDMKNEELLNKTIATNEKVVLTYKDKDSKDYTVELTSSPKIKLSEAKEALKATVSYDPTTTTTGTVTATIKTNKKVEKVDGWKLSEDGMTLTKKYSKNETEKVKLVAEDGTEKTVTVKVSNIKAKSTKTNSSSTNKTTGKKDNTVSPTILPQTGLGRGIMAIVVIATVYGIYAYRKYNYLKDIK